TTTLHAAKRSKSRKPAAMLLFFRLISQRSTRSVACSAKFATTLDRCNTWSTTRPASLVSLPRYHRRRLGFHSQCQFEGYLLLLSGSSSPDERTRLWAHCQHQLTWRHPAMGQPRPLLCVESWSHHVDQSVSQSPCSQNIHKFRCAGRHR